MRLPFLGRRRARKLREAARTVAERAPETLTVVTQRAQPGAITVARLSITGMIAYAAALLLPYHVAQPVLAPLTALLVGQVTLYHTLRTAIQRVAAVLAGVLVAVSLSAVVGLTWWSLAITLVAGLTFGLLLRLGRAFLEVPISAMLILSVAGGTEQAAAGRFVETLVGAGAGLISGLVLATPRTESAREAISQLCNKLSALLDRMADGVSSGAAGQSAGAWLRQARLLADEIERVSDAIQQAEESVVLSPRALRTVPEELGFRDSLETLEHAAITARGVARSVADLARLGDQDATVRERQERDRLAEVLAELSEAVRHYDRLATAPDPLTRDRAESGLRDRLDTARNRQDKLSALLAADPAERPAAWPLRGELVSHMDRFRHELETASGPGD
ncbi:MAG: FUSC family protein, partial [Actinobacteria bacterium]|nr:FUSC family protein [Actinomycetota bacterium]